MPCRGPRYRPAAISRSAARAASRAWSTGRSVVKALSRGSPAAMRASTASSSSTGETSRRCIRSAASASDRRTSPGWTTRGLYHAPPRGDTARRALAPAADAGQYGPVAELGFILTPTYRVVGGRPEVHLYGVLEGGEPALIVDDRQTPYFFIRAADAGVAAGHAGTARVVAADLVTFGGDPVVRVEVARPADVPTLRTRLGDAGVECFEADLRFAYRYLIDRGVKGGFGVEGPFERRPGVGRVYRNPALEPADFAPRLRVLSLDIETSPDASRLYSVAVAGAGGERGPFGRPAPAAGARGGPRERALPAALPPDG